MASLPSLFIAVNTPRTSARPITEVKPRQTRIVPGYVNYCEHGFPGKLRPGEVNVFNVSNFRLKTPQIYGYTLVVIGGT